jgi:hypothetical protein
VLVFAAVAYLLRCEEMTMFVRLAKEKVGSLKKRAGK